MQVCHKHLVLVCRHIKFGEMVSASTQALPDSLSWSVVGKAFFKQSLSLLQQVHAHIATTVAQPLVTHNKASG